MGWWVPGGSPDTPRERIVSSTVGSPDVFRGFGKCSLSRLKEIDATRRGIKRDLSRMELEDEIIDEADCPSAPGPGSEDEENYNLA